MWEIVRVCWVGNRQVRKRHKVSQLQAYGGGLEAEEVEGNRDIRMEVGERPEKA
jgi:hypothetical protein